MASCLGAPAEPLLFSHHPDTTPLPPNRALRYRPCMDQLSALNIDITHLACTSCIDASMLSVHDGLRLGPRQAEVVTPLQKILGFIAATCHTATKSIANNRPPQLWVVGKQPAPAQSQQAVPTATLRKEGVPQVSTCADARARPYASVTGSTSTVHVGGIGSDPSSDGMSVAGEGSMRSTTCQR